MQYISKGNNMDADIERLKHMIKFCEHIEDRLFAFGTEDNAMNDELEFLFPCAFALIQVGEDARHISNDMKSKYPEIDWMKFVRLQDDILHDYENVNMAELWDVVANDIPMLNTKCQSILSVLNGGVEISHEERMAALFQDLSNWFAPSPDMFPYSKRNDQK